MPFFVSLSSGSISEPTILRLFLGREEFDSFKFEDIIAIMKD